MKIKVLFTATATMCGLWLMDQTVFAQWSIVNQTVGNVPISTMILLPDGTVMGQVNGGTGWQKLTPDSTGNYANGTWANTIPAMNYTRTFFSSAVVQNGKVFVAGGEYGSGKNWVEVYDPNPAVNSWTPIGTNYFGGIADGECVVLNNGQVLDYPQAPFGTYAGDSFLFDPYSYTWSGPIPALNPNGNLNLSESSWVKMADDSILTVDSDQSSYGAYTAERFLPGINAWTSAGTLPVSIWADLPKGGIVGETGPGFLLPNGNVIFFGGSGHTAIYQTGSATWIQGPDIPNGRVMGDAPGAMMPNGKILLCVGPQLIDSTNANNDWQTPVSFYEYDYSVGATGAYTQVLAPGNSSYILNSDITYPCRMLVLPTGNVLFIDGNQQLGSQLYVYQMDSPALPAGRPTINKVQWNQDGSLHIIGTLLDGISEGAAYGDNQQMATDFPLVRFTDGSGNVYYGRTYNWSSTSVQTGGRIMSTEVAVPSAVFDSPNSFSLQVVANGNASYPVTFYSPVWVDFNYGGIFQFGSFPYPYGTLPQGVSAVANGGTIAVNASIQPSTGHESVPYTISTPMTIISVYGPSTIGN